jgi:N6-adenosine-specific RNA methylase IME4
VTLKTIRMSKESISGPAGDQALVKYDAAVRALAEAKRVDEVKDIRDQWKAMLVYAQQAKDKRIIEYATAIKLRAERKAGQLLRELDKNQGAVKGKTGRKGKPVLDTRPKLSELGISKTQSSYWQRLAGLDEAKFEAQVVAAQGKASRSLDGLHRELKRQQAREEYKNGIGGGCTVADLRELVDSKRKFGVILADFPWDYVTYSDKGKDRSADQHYDVLDIAGIDAITPLIWELAGPNCALFLWTTWAHLPLALKVLAASGFQYSTGAFDWVKTSGAAAGADPDQLKDSELHFGMGHTTRLGSEPVLLGLRGSPVRLNSDVRQVVIAPVGEHSEKPEEVRRRIERLYPGPYLELFGRKSAPGWSVWGNEIPRDNFKDRAADSKTMTSASSPAIPADDSIPEFLRRT